ncbi:hypothetical protein BDN70DRAFT_885887 [Pholiota conissans]|uniref:DUF7726 domain-containing protein n=1 Tax=Pholiota conissans TaxID=109636 RepID=A0A9P5YRL9_9AGAR|nr:hypothetical protein BDN70DRAFT_885887 [Pholiota conissans]
MAPKRKSDAMDSEYIPPDALAAEPSSSSSSSKATSPIPPEDTVPRKKARVSDASKPKKTAGKAKENNKYQSWRDVKLEGEDERNIEVYDDCNDVRRKIRQLLQTPGFKVTYWLQEIGINSNSYGRFMKENGKYDGQYNGTYFAAYVYFEKNRILQGKKKTAKRIASEKEHKASLSR